MNNIINDQTVIYLQVFLLLSIISLFVINELLFEKEEEEPKQTVFQNNLSLRVISKLKLKFNSDITELRKFLSWYRNNKMQNNNG